MSSTPEIFEKVRTELVGALAVDESEVEPQATIMGDLGAESIDFLDIVFRLEKAFNIKIPKGELFPDSLFTDAQFVQDNRLTEAGVAELRKRMPFVDLDAFAKNPNVKDFNKLFTVQTICDFVAFKLNAAK